MHDVLMVALLGAVSAHTIRLRRKLNQHAAYLDELGELAKAFGNTAWDYKRNAWRDIKHPDGHWTLVPVR